MDRYDVVTIVVDGDERQSIDKRDYINARNLVIIENDTPLNAKQKKSLKRALPQAIWWSKRLQHQSQPPTTPIWPYTDCCKSLWVTKYCNDLSKQCINMRAAATGCSSSVSRVLKNFQSGKLSDTIIRDFTSTIRQRCLIDKPQSWIDEATDYVFSRNMDMAFPAWKRAVFEGNHADLMELFEEYDVLSKVPLPRNDEAIDEKFV